MTLSVVFSPSPNFRRNHESKINGLGWWGRGTKRMLWWYSHTWAQHALAILSLYAPLTPVDFSYAMGFQTSVYEVKSLGDNTLEFGGERVGVGEVRWRGGKVCRTLKFRTLPPHAPMPLETSIQNLQRSTFFAIITQTSNIPHIQKHGWEDDIGEKWHWRNLTLTQTTLSYQIN